MERPSDHQTSGGAKSRNHTGALVRAQLRVGVASELRAQIRTKGARPVCELVGFVCGQNQEVLLLVPSESVEALFFSTVFIQTVVRAFGSRMRVARLNSCWKRHILTGSTARRQLHSGTTKVTQHAPSGDCRSVVLPDSQPARTFEDRAARRNNVALQLHNVAVGQCKQHARAQYCPILIHIGRVSRTLCVPLPWQLLLELGSR